MVSNTELDNCTCHAAFSTGRCNCNGSGKSEVVDLIASGYEWHCPNCKEFNTEIEIENELECAKCKHKFSVGTIDHAYH